jgi:hypothetical protein
MDVNIMSDRGSNFVKAFADFEPMFCFGHRLNNVLKVGFFQQAKKKKPQTGSSKSKSAIINAQATTSILSNEYVSSDSDSNTSESEAEEDENASQRKYGNTTIKMRKNKKSSTELAEKLTIEQLPSKAKEVILCLKYCKKLVKYVKLVNISEIYIPVERFLYFYYCDFLYIVFRLV